MVPKKTQMDKHLLMIQRETRAALDRFKSSGFKVDTEFLENFLEQSIDCLRETCRAFEVEAKSETLCNVTAVMTSASGIEESMNASSRADEPDALIGKDDKSMKREANNLMNVERTLLKKPKTMEINVDGNTDQSEQFSHTVFLCTHCLDDQNPSKSYSGTIDDVYGHWMAAHLDESICKPFQFYTFALSSCFHCKEVGTYHDLVKHHKEQHSGQQFTIVDRMDVKKCGMCHLNEGDMVQHFKTKHTTVMKLDCLNPIAYNKERIDEFLSINLHHNFYRGQKRPGYLICGFCKKNVGCDQYLSHFNEHSYKFKCSYCTFCSTDLVDLVVHEKTYHKVDSLNFHCSSFFHWIRKKFLNTTLVFGNGLCLKRFNVVRTKFDESRYFDEFINGFLNMKREEAKRQFELIGTNDTTNGAQEAT